MISAHGGFQDSMSATQFMMMGGVLTQVVLHPRTRRGLRDLGTFAIWAFPRLRLGDGCTRLVRPPEADVYVSSFDPLALLSSDDAEAVLYTCERNFSLLSTLAGGSCSEVLGEDIPGLLLGRQGSS